MFSSPKIFEGMIKKVVEPRLQYRLRHVITQLAANDFHPGDHLEEQLKFKRENQLSVQLKGLLDTFEYADEVVQALKSSNNVYDDVDMRFIASCGEYNSWYIIYIKIRALCFNIYMKMLL
jgi:hypothetical protein